MKMRNALSLLELIFVIVILGIMASIGADIIAQTYESYIVQRAQYRASTKTELALTQIANRLRYAIPRTVGFRADITEQFHGITEPNTGNDKVLQWVAYDGDSFEAITDSIDRKPGWSGFCDIDAYSGGTSFPTPGSNFNLLSTIVHNLGGDVTTGKIIFPDNTAYGISGGAGESFTLDSAIPSNATIYERYKFAWSSYALVCENGSAQYPCGDLYLYYNFTPDVGAPIGTTKSLLLKDVSNFRFKGSEGAIRVKICREEQVGMDANNTIHACKEKVIF